MTLFFKQSIATDSFFLYRPKRVSPGETTLNSFVF